MPGNRSATGSGGQEAKPKRPPLRVLLARWLCRKRLGGTIVPDGVADVLDGVSEYHYRKSGAADVLCFGYRGVGRITGLRRTFVHERLAWLRAEGALIEDAKGKGRRGTRWMIAPQVWEVPQPNLRHDAEAVYPPYEDPEVGLPFDGETRPVATAGADTTTPNNLTVSDRQKSRSDRLGGHKKPVATAGADRTGGIRTGSKNRGEQKPPNVENHSTEETGPQPMPEPGPETQEVQQDPSKPEQPEAEEERNPPIGSRARVRVTVFDGDAVVDLIEYAMAKLGGQRAKWEKAARVVLTTHAPRDLRYAVDGALVKSHRDGSPWTRWCKTDPYRAWSLETPKGNHPGKTYLLEAHEASQKDNLDPGERFDPESALRYAWESVRREYDHRPDYLSAEMVMARSGGLYDHGYVVGERPDPQRLRDRIEAGIQKLKQAHLDRQAKEAAERAKKAEWLAKIKRETETAVPVSKGER